MDLYRLHTNPETLPWHDVAYETVPDVAWNDAYNRRDDDELRRLEHLWAKHSKYAYYYAKDVLQDRFPAGEAAIAQDPSLAISYAHTHFDDGERFLEAEPNIVTDAKTSYLYASLIMSGRFPEGEDAIATNSYYSYRYARDVLNGPFPKGESTIAKDPQHSYLYAKNVLYDSFPEGEAAIFKDPEMAERYDHLVNRGGLMF